MPRIPLKFACFATCTGQPRRIIACRRFGAGVFRGFAPPLHADSLLPHAEGNGIPHKVCTSGALKPLTTLASLLKVRDKALQTTTQHAGTMDMKNVYEVLRQKEMELTRLEKEVEALRVVAPLLSEEKESDMVKPTLAAVNGPQATARISVPAPPSIPAPQPVRAAGWEDTA